MAEGHQFKVKGPYLVDAEKTVDSLLEMAHPARKGAPRIGVDQNQGL